MVASVLNPSYNGRAMNTSTYDGKAGLDELKTLPETPGVYFFLDDAEEILYIGKATSLRDRVRSYFASDLMDTRGPKLVRMIGLARNIAWKTSDSVLEALILESGLIKEHQPPYNTFEKDDKSYNHVVVTDEEFPRILLVRGRDLAEGKFTAPIRSLFGPFPNGGQLKEAVRIVRKIFPFRDNCEPYEPTTDNRQPTTGNGTGSFKIQNSKFKIPNDKPCFNRQIGLCPGVCTGEVSAKEYGKTVRNIERFFQGKKTDIVRSLTREMKSVAGKLEFERANEIKRTIFALGHIHDVSLLAGDSGESEREGNGVRIEAYDVAHLGGGSSVGVMTVFSGNAPDKDSYRKFLLRGKHVGNDLSALEEILRRRLKHSEWPMPDVVAVDGSLLQHGVAERVFGEAGGAFAGIRIVGVVKNSKHQPERLIGDRESIADYRREILLANAEAHRFAITYHRKRRGKDFLPNR
ncbi:MAG: GIY-YIG nuclease family protein [Candidatus Moranbacteria bacterium]|nr:GIY-YIG nuclease family protein [Candidatus Moranbacteria bacterium]